MRRPTRVAVLSAALAWAVAGLALAQPAAAPAMPAGHPPAGMAAGMPGAASDSVLPDPSLAAGTVVATVLDGAQSPVAGAAIVLSIVRESVEKGEQRDSRAAETDGEGSHRFEALPTSQHARFRLSTSRGGARFSTPEFSLDAERGVRVRLHAYQPVTELGKAALVFQTVVSLQIEQDTITVSQLVHTTNLGKTAYLPTDVKLSLPAGAKAFRAEPGPNGASLQEHDGVATLVGTFPPGRADFSFRYQVPLEGGSEQLLVVPQLPRMLQTRVMVGAGPQMGLRVTGFPQARAARRHDGQRVLETTERADLRTNLPSLMTNTEAGSLEITLTGLPEQGFGRWLAAALGIVALAVGLWQRGTSRDSRQAAQAEIADLLEARDTLLADLARLERARTDGDVGPKSYRKIRQALLDALARILTKIDDAGQRDAGLRLPGEPAPRKAKRKRRRGRSSEHESGGKRRGEGSRA